MSKESKPVKPLGVFGRHHDLEPVREELLRLAGALPLAERPAIASYLGSGAIISPLMECTTDVIGAFPQIRREKIRSGVHILEVTGGAFAVSGGSGILSDGTYFWRRDAAEYVEHYGIGLPEDFLQHGRTLGWVAPSVTREEVMAIWDYLHAERRGSLKSGES